MGEIKYLGAAPFSLPPTQGAKARAESGLVGMTVYVVVPELGNVPVPIQTAMIPQTARFLADQLIGAATEAEVY